MIARDSNELKKDADEALIAIFHAGQYLGDVACQQAMVKVARAWPDKRPATQQLVASFHPLTMDELKQASDLDVYCLQSVRGGSLNRVHLVKSNGFARINPPPDDYRCDSCHVKGWLRKEFEISKIDGAVVPIWLCLACTKLEPKERDIRF